MNNRTTFIVLLIAVALTTYFLVFVYDWSQVNPPTDAAETAAGERLFDDVDSPAIQTITIRRANQPDLVFRREGDGWRQTAPVAWPAKAWRLDDIADAVATLRYTRTLDDIDPAKYGLAPAQREIVIEGDRFTHTVRLGRQATAGKAFVSTETDLPIYVVGLDLHEATDERTPEALRQNKLGEIQPHQVQRIELRGEQATVALTPADGRWTFVAGAAGRVDDDAVESLLGVIQHATISDFVADHPDDLSRYGLAAPRRVLTVTTDDQTHVLKIGAPRHLLWDTPRNMGVTLRQNYLDTWSQSENGIHIAQDLVFGIPNTMMVMLNGVVDSVDVLHTDVVLPLAGAVALWPPRFLTGLLEGVPVVHPLLDAIPKAMWGGGMTMRKFIMVVSDQTQKGVNVLYKTIHDPDEIGDHFVMYWGDGKSSTHPAPGKLQASNEPTAE